MNYPEWNNGIGHYIFNESNSGKEVLLYLTKQDIINIGKTFRPGEPDDAIWRNFLLSIKIGISSSSASVAENAEKAYNKWIELKSALIINRIPVKYPLYLSYLVFFVLPLTEGAVAGDYTMNNYWDRMKEFLTANGCKLFPQSDFRDRKINDLWNDLHIWANRKKNGELGLFTVNEFVNSGFKYVGKPFSQCILPPKVISKFPLLFSKAGLIPGERYTDAAFRQNVINYGSHAGIHPKVIEQVRKKPDDELTGIVVRKVRCEYEIWEGQADVNTDRAGNDRQQRYETIAGLVLQLEVDEDYGNVVISYRVKSQTEFPEDLRLSGYEVRSDWNGFSNTLNIPLHTASFELKDDFNKWIAKCQVKRVRMFVNGSYYQLSSDYWVEVDSLVPGQAMYILGPVQLNTAILQWAQTSCKRYTSMDGIEGIPSHLSLIKIDGVLNSSTEVSELYLDSKISIQLVGGLKTKHRSYADVSLPQVEVINGVGEDKVALRYQGIKELIYLTRQVNSHYWSLPDKIELDTPFWLGVENKGYEEELSYKIISAKGAALRLGDTHLPLRDTFGNTISEQETDYIRGINLSNPKLSRQGGYVQHFRGLTDHTGYQPVADVPCNLPGDKLLTYLTLKRVSSSKEFFSVFEQLYHDAISAGQIISVSTPVQRLKWAALTHYSNLGFVDYDYEGNDIAVLPPQLILIPTKQDRKVLFIGGRDEEMIEKIKQLAIQHELSLLVHEQTRNRNLLLPSIITLQSHQYPNDVYGERRLQDFANAAGLHIDTGNLIQIGLRNFSVDANEYEADVKANNLVDTKDYGWARYVFNPENLELEPSVNASFETRFLFVEYRLNSWEIYHLLWIDGQPYKTDKYWGRYLALKKAGKNVILYDAARERAGVPLHVPLPRYFAMSLSLLSGKAPSMAIIDGRQYRIYENVTSDFVQNLFQKLSQTIIPSQIIT